MRTVHCVVCHSGGMDSSITLKLMADRYTSSGVLSLGFFYGQKNEQELIAAKRIAEEFGVKREVIDLRFLATISESALLTSSTKPIQREAGRVATTEVVGRNGLMAHIAAMVAHHLHASSIAMGVMGLEEANSGYRDCSQEYMERLEALLRIDLNDPKFTIETPLIAMTKAESCFKAEELGILSFLLETTVTCYRGLSGKGCQSCPACKLREEGLQEFLAKKSTLKEV